MTPALLLLACLTPAAPSLLVVPPGSGAAGVDPYALAGRAAAASQGVVDGDVVLAAPPAATCDLACRLRSAASSGAPRVLVVQTSALLDTVQVGALVFALPAQRATGQCSERVRAVDVDGALARCVRAALGKPLPEDAAAATAARAGPVEGGAPVRVVVAPVKISEALAKDEATRSALGTRAAGLVAREPGFVAVATADVAAVLDHEANRALAGSDNGDAYEAAARALDARLLLRVDVGVVGDVVVVSAALVDVTLANGSPPRADVLVGDASEVPEAIDVVVAQLFGRPAKLPPPRVRRSRFEAGMHGLVPGGGQFWNGPEHTWKGVVVAVGTGLGVVAGGALLAARVAVLDGRSQWGRGTANFIGNGCDADQTVCDAKVAELESTGATMLTAAWASFATGTLFWSAGIVEAVAAAE
ncbi:MAG: hypothetical protein FJ137_22280 [Deltaproteobacteria bacterium]|nr:hypothetical protein [Deltaproteobacteria bacterium]